MRKLPVSELNRLTAEAYKAAPKLPVILVLDDVRSAYNVGSVFRTADAFRVESLYLCGISARPPHKDIFKTALGATDSVEWKYFDDIGTALGKLKKDGYAIFAVEQTDPSIRLSDFSLPDEEKMVLVFGHEVKGVSEKALSFARACLEIPQFGTKHSLNISVSVGITLWEVIQKIIQSADWRTKLKL